MLDLSDDMIRREETSANLYYRRAFALRRLERFEQAVEEIDRALDMLPSGQNDVHQDYVRERELITTSWTLSDSANELTSRLRDELSQELESKFENASSALAEQIQSAQRTISDSLLKIVEILGLFVTLAGFLVGSGAVVLKAASFGQRFASMVLVLLGSLVFFVLLRVTIGFRRSR